MFNDISSDEFSTNESDRFYKQEWSVFVRQVDQMTGGSLVARQLFIDAREMHLSGEL